jgi:hypothetical protein
LSLSKPCFYFFEALGLVDLLTIRKSERLLESGIAASFTRTLWFDTFDISINKKTKIPFRGTFKKSSTLNFLIWNILFVKAKNTDARQLDMNAIISSNRI